MSNTFESKFLNIGAAVAVAVGGLLMHDAFPDMGIGGTAGLYNDVEGFFQGHGALVSSPKEARQPEETNRVAERRLGEGLMALVSLGTANEFRNRARKKRSEG